MHLRTSRAGNYIYMKGRSPDKVQLCYHCIRDIRHQQTRVSGVCPRLSATIRRYTTWPGVLNANYKKPSWKSSQSPVNIRLESSYWQDDKTKVEQGQAWFSDITRSHLDACCQSCLLTTSVIRKHLTCCPIQYQGARSRIFLFPSRFLLLLRSSALWNSVHARQHNVKNECPV